MCSIIQGTHFYHEICPYPTFIVRLHTCDKLRKQHFKEIAGISDQIRSDQSLSRVRLFATP